MNVKEKKNTHGRNTQQQKTFDARPTFLSQHFSVEWSTLMALASGSYRYARLKKPSPVKKEPKQSRRLYAQKLSRYSSSISHRCRFGVRKRFPKRIRFFRVVFFPLLMTLQVSSRDLKTAATCRVQAEISNVVKSSPMDWNDFLRKRPTTNLFFCLYINFLFRPFLRRNSILPFHSIPAGIDVEPALCSRNPIEKINKIMHNDFPSGGWAPS